MIRAHPPILALLLLTAGVYAQSPGPAGQQSYSSGVTAVLVDVVVRDRAGRPVTDLSASDFQLSEEGVPQTIASFTRVSRGSGIGVGVAWRAPAPTTIVNPSGTEAAAGVDLDETPPTTAILFDHLTSETLRLAQRATLAYLPMSGEAKARIGVFAADPGVRVLQAYTTDPARVRKAIERVTPSGDSTGEDRVQRADELMARRTELRGQAESAAAGAVTGTGAALAQNASELGRRETELQLLQTELNMIRSFENLDRDHRGYDTTLALHAVIRSLAEHPGRKTIVLFSEGLPASPALSASLDSLIDAANRSNVTAYAIDAKGLRATSTLANARREVETFADERMFQNSTGTIRTHQPLTMSFERVEDTLRLDSRTGLARLAEDTGGFLVEQSNDMSAAFRRIDEDNQFHYLLTYSPTNTQFDGKFRTIQVKVRRPGLRVFARNGYRAGGGPRRASSGSFELPALALLNRRPLPNAFPVHAGGFSFPDPARPGLTPVIVRLETGVLRFALDQHRSTYSAQAAIVVRILDGEGQEVQKFSQDYILSGEAGDVDAAKRGEILFYRDADLAPGLYTMEAVVFDAGARQGSARIGTLTVPPVEASVPGMSSLILARRVEEVREEEAVASHVAAPLYVGRVLIYPSLGEPIEKSRTSELPFYFTVYGRLREAKVLAQLLRNGEPLAEAPMTLPLTSGERVQHVGRLPVSALPAGTYELRIRVLDGERELSRAAYFTLRD
ncbi:MAG TPA: VWA domain-containing protein [Vicinamibacterales bacterium]|nr:VWA domain-containing protein [Vicinamibacterales bacterium]